MGKHLRSFSPANSFRAARKWVKKKVGRLLMLWFFHALRVTMTQYVWLFRTLYVPGTVTYTSLSPMVDFWQTHPENRRMFTQCRMAGTVILTATGQSHAAVGLPQECLCAHRRCSSNHACWGCGLGGISEAFIECSHSNIGIHDVSLTQMFEPKRKKPLNLVGFGCNYKNSFMCACGAVLLRFCWDCLSLSSSITVIGDPLFANQQIPGRWICSDSSIDAGTCCAWLRNCWRGTRMCGCDGNMARLLMWLRRMSAPQCVLGLSDE